MIVSYLFTAKEKISYGSILSRILAFDTMCYHYKQYHHTINNIGITFDFIFGLLFRSDPFLFILYCHFFSFLLVNRFDSFGSIQFECKKMATITATDPGTLFPFHQHDHQDYSQHPQRYQYWFPPRKIRIPNNCVFRFFYQTVYSCTIYTTFLVFFFF